MAKTSLSKEAVAEQPNTPDAQILHSMGEAPDSDGGNLPATAADMGIGSVGGDVDDTDFVTPQLRITQAVGKLSETFDGGDIVYNNTCLLVKQEVKLYFTVLSLNKTFEEIIPYGEDDRPQTFNTMAEVLQAGFTTKYGNDGTKATARPVTHAMVLIQQPEELEATMFATSIGGKNHAVGMWTMRSVAYGRAAKPLYSSLRLGLRTTGILGGRWSLMTKREKMGNGNMIWVPVLELESVRTPEEIAEVSAYFG